mmetsp:Transcript_53860/g.125643  ORF Transcript_53860/g.125643 Transcript_53860/m.125643 type:complete len:226 (+) Transcript_53860:879-1556(+)
MPWNKPRMLLLLLSHRLWQDACCSLLLSKFNRFLLASPLRFCRQSLPLQLLLLPQFLLLPSTLLLLFQNFSFCNSQLRYGLPLLLKLGKLQGVNFLSFFLLLLDSLYLPQLFSKLCDLLLSCCLGPFFSCFDGRLLRVLLFAGTRLHGSGRCSLGLGLCTSLSVFVFVLLFGLLRVRLLTYEKLRRPVYVLVGLDERVTDLVIAELRKELLHLPHKRCVVPSLRS